MSLAFSDLIILTCRSLTGSLVRSGLTTLGVFMGVAAVNATLQVGDISRAMIAKQIAERDAPHLMISFFSSEGGGRMPKLEDMEFLQRRLKGIKAISALNYVYMSEKVFYQGEEGKPMMFAVTQNYHLTTGRKILEGRNFNAADFNNYRSVAILDKFLSDKLFKNADPIGKVIFNDGKPFMVVGITENKMTLGGEPQGTMMIPMSTYSSMTGSQFINGISIRPQNQDTMEALGKKAEGLLKKRFPGADVYSYSNIQDLLMQQQIYNMASLGLNVVGIIALLIGGVGITNITIAAVIERTGEIGLRRAIGATKLEILLQFILEAIILSLIGGATAIVCVNSLTFVITTAINLPYNFEIQTAVLSLGSALLVGVGACLFPAIRASQLDPVKALREN